MARPRLPAAKARASGAAVKNPGRFKGRGGPKGLTPLGGPSAHLTTYERRAFERFRAEASWLTEADRLVVELAASLRAKILDPEREIELKELQELRRCLGALGMTPADRSKVAGPDGDEDDPDDAFFNRPN